MSAPQEARLLELVEAYLDDDLTDGEARELRTLVKRDQVLRERFLTEVRWHIHLTDRLRTQGIPLSERVDAVLDAEGRTPRIADAVAASIAARSSRRNKISTRFLRRKRREAAPWWLAAAAGLLLAVGLFLVVPSGGSSSATVIGDRGSIERAGQTLRLGSQPHAVADGDVLVADGSALLLRFSDGTEVELSSGARMSVRSGSLSGAKHLELERGALLARVAKQKSDESLLVATPQAHATVLGTTFRVRIESVGTRLTVEEGRIAFARSSGGERLEVVGGRSAIANIDGSLALIEPVKPPVVRVKPVWVPEPFSPTGGRPFGDDSPYNQVIPKRVVLDVDSAAMVARLANEQARLALLKYGLPVYDAQADTPVRAITVTRRDRPDLKDQQIRIPVGVTPNSGSNRSLVVLDWTSRRAWELYRFDWVGDAVRVESGGSVAFDGTGIPKPSSGYAGGSYLAGLLRVREIERGFIPHALAFGTKYARRGTSRHPAQQTDGKLTGADTIPVGARIQLDPTLDLDAIAGLTPGERTIAEALQTYGAYCVGASGEPFLFFCERAPDAGTSDPGAVYSANGFTGDAAPLSRIPWDRLRVLKQWDGAE